MHTELLGDGFLVVAIGLSMVFGMLILISLILSLFSFYNNIVSNRKKVILDKELSEEVSEVTVSENVVAAEQEKDDLEVIAVISAAVAASMGTTADKIVIRSLRRTSEWNETSIYESQNTLF